MRGCGRLVEQLPALDVLGGGTLVEQPLRTTVARRWVAGRPFVILLCFSEVPFRVGDYLSPAMVECR